MTDEASRLDATALPFADGVITRWAWAQLLLEQLWRRLPAEDLVAYAAAQELNSAAVDGLVAWQTAEGGGGANARWNPLNTTWRLPGTGATDYNAVGVQNYPDLLLGLDATVRTLCQGAYGYPAIITALREGTVAQLGAAVLASQWGTRTWPETVTDAMRQAPVSPPRTRARIAAPVAPTC